MKLNGVAIALRVEGTFCRGDRVSNRVGAIVIHHVVLLHPLKV